MVKFGKATQINIRISVDDFTSATDFWKELEFQVLHESEDPYPWGIVSDSMMVIGLHLASLLL